MCANDEMATGAMVSARDHGIELPAQLSIIGYDNVFFTRHVYPPLSTINYPIDEMGKVAAQWVLSHVYQKSVQPIQTLFQPELVIRQSVVNIT